MEDMTFYKYKVNWWADADNEDLDDQGFVLARDYSHAAQQLNKAFDYINSMTIEAINDSYLLSYEDILEALGGNTQSSCLGPQIIEALQDAIAEEGKND
jgi:hypothetical protein